jgi:peptidoglycan/xylan/chitin deacetylase (PgdA/CDA1 family)
MPYTPKLRASAAPAAKALLLNSGIYSILRRVAPSRHLAILRYHAICERNAGYAEPGICVSPAHFVKHLSYLRDNYHVLPLSEAVDALCRGASLPANAVAITFDDGYADNFGAAEQLASRGLPATFYITAGCLADGAPFWPSELRGLVQTIGPRPIELRVNGRDVSLPSATDSDRAAAVSALTKLFKANPIPVRENLRDQLRSLAGASCVPSPMLTWTQVAAMHRMGMEIGSHTMTHPNLPNAGLQDAAREITESKRTLETHLGSAVTMFSYPNGGAERYMTKDVARLVREAGFLAATTSRNAFATRYSDPFALERVQVSEALDELVFALEIERFAFKPQPRPGERP